MAKDTCPILRLKTDYKTLILRLTDNSIDVNQTGSYYKTL